MGLVLPNVVVDHGRAEGLRSPPAVSGRRARELQIETLSASHAEGQTRADFAKVLLEKSAAVGAVRYG